MRMSGKSVVCSICLCAIVNAASADPVVWTDWTASQFGTNGSAEGVLKLPGGDVDITFTGPVFNGQTCGGTGYWGFPSAYLSSVVSNVPTGTDIIQTHKATTTPNVIQFSQPLTNPIMAIVSLGRDNFMGPLEVRYNFGQPFTIISQGAGSFGSGPLTALPGDVLAGLEGHGVIRFPGTFSQITFSVDVDEQWNGFTIGVIDGCYADCDSNGTLNIFDYICFGNAYSASDEYANCDNNCDFNIFDYICFGAAYADACN